MNIVIPMAGGGGNFQNIGYGYTKNFFEIHDKPLFQCVCESLADFKDENFIFIVRKEDADKFHIDKSLKLLSPGSNVIVSEGKTAGAACSALLAAEFIDNDEELLIHNGDQIITANMTDIITYFRKEGVDGGIATFESVHPRWSYLRCNENQIVVEAAEKTPISKHATAGFYWFKRGADFVKSAKRMIKKDANVNGSYYVCTVYNEMILEQKRIICREILRSEYFPLTHPKEAALYEEYLRSKK